MKKSVYSMPITSHYYQLHILSDLNKTVEVSSIDNLMLLPNPIDHSYSCSIECQVQLTGNESTAGVSNIYLRITDISGLETFENAGKAENSKSFTFECWLLRSCLTTFGRER